MQLNRTRPGTPVKVANSPIAITPCHQAAAKRGAANLWRLGQSAQGMPARVPAAPVSAAVPAPQSDSAWMVMLALRLSKPSRYYFGKARINYVTNGKPGWQDQNIHITIDEVRGFNPGRLC